MMMMTMMTPSLAAKRSVITIMYHKTKFGDKRTGSSKDTVGIVIFWSKLSALALTLTLTFKIANQSFCITLWLMMMHHNNKSGNKMFSGLEDIIWTNINIVTLCCDLDLEYSNPVLFHRTIWLMIIYHQIKFGCHWISSSENIVERVILWSYEPDCDLDLEKSNNNDKKFCMTLLLMMLHHYIKFGNKMFCDSEYINRTNSYWHFKPLLWPRPWTQQSHFSTGQSSLWC